MSNNPTAGAYSVHITYSACLLQESIFNLPLSMLSCSLAVRREMGLKTTFIDWWCWGGQGYIMPAGNCCFSIIQSGHSRMYPGLTAYTEKRLCHFFMQTGAERLIYFQVGFRQWFTALQIHNLVSFFLFGGDGVRKLDIFSFLLINPTQLLLFLFF